MSKVVFTQGFLEDVQAITSPKVREHLRSVLSMIETFPRSGSDDTPSYIHSRYGGEVRKCVVKPFDLIHTYHPESDDVMVRALVPQRSVH